MDKIEKTGCQCNPCACKSAGCHCNPCTCKNCGCWFEGRRPGDRVAAFPPLGSSQAEPKSV